MMKTHGLSCRDDMYHDSDGGVTRIVGNLGSGKRITSPEPQQS
jgi:hypothetical protein